MGASQFWVETKRGDAGFKYPLAQCRGNINPLIHSKENHNGVITESKELFPSLKFSIIYTTNRKLRLLLKNLGMFNILYKPDVTIPGGSARG